MVKIVTACTNKKYYFTQLEQSCNKFGGEFVVLGMGEKWRGYIWKFEKMIHYLHSLAYDEIVCFVDGYDVLCVKNLQTLEEDFLRFKNNTNCKIIIGCDDATIVPHFIQKFYFGSYGNSSINSGTYIGFAGDILDILKKARIDFPDVVDDQMLITQYANKYMNEICVDNNCEFFQVCSDPLNEAKLVGDPYFIHGPGCTYLNNICEQLGLQVDRQVKNNLRLLFIEKSYYHFFEFVKKIKWALVILAFVIIFLKYSRRYSMKRFQYS